MGVFSCAAVIPLYNKAPHIARALDSVRAQTLAPREIIVVDDGSTDGGAELVEAYRDPRIRLLRRHAPGPGGYAARNLAIKTARSPWIAFLDADDEWLPTHLADISEVADADGVFTGFSTHMPGGVSSTSPFSRTISRRSFSFDQVLDLWLEHRSCPMWTGALAFRRDLLLGAGLFPEGRCRRGGDKDLWLRASSRGRMVGIGRVSAIYHADSSNMVTRRTPTAQTHCIWPTIEALLQGASAQRARKLKQLYNLQVSEYVYARWREGCVEPECSEGFFRDEAPLQYMAIRAMQRSASPKLAALLRYLAKVRAQVRGPTIARAEA